MVERSNWFVQPKMTKLSLGKFGFFQYESLFDLVNQIDVESLRSIQNWSTALTFKANDIFSKSYECLWRITDHGWKTLDLTVPDVIITERIGLSYFVCI